MNSSVALKFVSQTALSFFYSFEKTWIRFICKSHGKYFLINMYISLYLATRILLKKQKNFQSLVGNLCIFKAQILSCEFATKISLKNNYLISIINRYLYSIRMDISKTYILNYYLPIFKTK